MPAESESGAGSPVGSVMSMSSVSNPATPGSAAQYCLANLSTSTGCGMSSDSFDSDLENNNVFGVSVVLHGDSINVKSEPTDMHTTPKKKRYTKSRVRNRSPALVQKLKKTRRSKANDRERSRMHSLNDALDGLRKILPNCGEDNKLTKIETLRFAYNYIFALKETLNMLDRGESIDIEDTLYSAQMSAAMKMPSASETLSQLNQLQQQLHRHEQQQQLSPLSVQSQMSPVCLDVQQQHGHVMSPQQTMPVIKTESRSPPVPLSEGQHVFHELSSPCYSTGSNMSHQAGLAHYSPASVSQDNGVSGRMTSLPVAEYSTYSNAGMWTDSPVFSFNYTMPHSSGLASPSVSNYSYMQVNNVC